MTTRTTPYAAALALVGLAAVGACSGGGDARPTEPSAAERLAAAKTRLDAASSVHLVISSPDFPGSAQGISAGDGTATRQPAFQGTMTVRSRGLSGKVDVVSVGGRLHLRLPFTRHFAQVDPADYGVPDPAQLLGSERGISSLLTKTTNPALGDKKRDGTAVTQTVTGTLPGDAVVDVLAAGERGGSFAATYTLAEDDTVRSVRLKGPFFPGAGQTTYDVALGDYGKQVTISAP